MNSTYLIHKGLFTSGGSFHSLGHANSREVMQVLELSSRLSGYQYFQQVGYECLCPEWYLETYHSIHNCLIHSNPFHSIDMDILISCKNLSMCIARAFWRECNCQLQLRFWSPELSKLQYNSLPSLQLHCDPNINRTYYQGLWNDGPYHSAGPISWDLDQIGVARGLGLLGRWVKRRKQKSLELDRTAFVPFSGSCPALNSQM